MACSLSLLIIFVHLLPTMRISGVSLRNLTYCNLNLEYTRLKMEGEIYSLIRHGSREIELKLDLIEAGFVLILLNSECLYFSRESDLRSLVKITLFGHLEARQVSPT